MNRTILAGFAAAAVLLFAGCRDEEYTVLTGIDSTEARQPVSRSLVLDVEEVEVPGTGVRLKLALVRAGRFVMGDGSAEAPMHGVRLTHDFYMATTEVTQQLYRAVAGRSGGAIADSTPSHFNYDGDYPVESVSFGDAMRFCERLSELTGYHFELPTEAQWEYAACGGANGARTAYAGGSMIGPVAWYKGNSPEVGYTGTSPYTGRDTLFHICRTSPVGGKSPNALGLYDMSGNVREWCVDGWSLLGSGDVVDPVCTTGTAQRVYRGGASNDSAQYCRVAHREAITADSKGFSIGFRVVVNMD